MLTREETQDLIERYGDTIAKVAREVAREYEAPGSDRGHGYEVVPADDIEQDTYAQLIETDTGADALDAMDEPQGWIRTTARLYGAANQARARRRDIQADFTTTPDEERYATTLGSYLAATTPADWGEPEKEADLGPSPLVEACALTVRRIVANLTGIPALVAEAFYLDGLDQRAVSERLGIKYDSVRYYLQSARSRLGADAEASLRAWREYAHPEAVKPWSTKKAGVPWALIETVTAINEAEAL